MTLLVDRMLTSGEGSFAIRAQSATRQRQMLEMRRRQERIALESRLKSFRLRKATLESSLDLLMERLGNTERQAELAADAYRRLSSLPEPAMPRFATPSLPKFTCFRPRRR